MLGFERSLMARSNRLNFPVRTFLRGGFFGELLRLNGADEKRRVYRKGAMGAEGRKVFWGGVRNKVDSLIAGIPKKGNFSSVIEDFSCKETEKIWNGLRSKRLPVEIQERAFLRLRQLHAAEILEDLRIPPSNRLESLSGDLKGFWSIRINQQWRLVFRWNDGKASDVKITDYH